jgi:hypothetical protein
MLFDLRSRGRRRTVQFVYIGLAVLIGSGLVLFGVGTGGGGGGLLGGLTGNSSSSGAAAVTSQTRKALAATQRSPDSASAWANLVAARFSAANSAGYDSATSTYTAAGKVQLQGATQAYARYLKLTRKPSENSATIAAKAYTQLGDWRTASITYQTVLASGPSNIHSLECVALTSYAAGDDRVAELAQARVLTKLPKSVRKATQTQLEGAKTSKTVVTETC